MNAAMRDALLRCLVGQAVIADTMEQGLDILAERLGSPPSRAALADTVQDAVAAGLAYDPVRLPQGALQCHWHLELTAQGRRAAQS